MIYVECKKYREKRCYMEENRGQGVISNRQKWCRCLKIVERKVAYSTKRKTQQKREIVKGKSGELSRC